MKSRRDRIRGVVSDLVGKFMYYDRKESESLPLGSIEAAIAAGEISVDEIIEHFAAELRVVIDESPRSSPAGCLPGECRCEARGMGCPHRQL